MKRKLYEEEREQSDEESDNERGDITLPTKKAAKAAAATTATTAFSDAELLHRFYSRQTLRQLKLWIADRKKSSSSSRSKQQLAALKQTGSLSELVARLVQDDLQQGHFEDSVAEQRIHEALMEEESTRKRPRVDRMPASLRDRVSRAWHERLYLLERTHQDELSASFKVLGSTGNVYDVTISEMPSCSCPDASYRCKHLLFVLLRILKVDEHSSVLYQHALLKSELRSIFVSASDAIPSAVSAAPNILNAYRAHVSGTAPTTANDKKDDELTCSATGVVRKPIGENDECPICFESLVGSDLCWCKSACGNNFHDSCISKLKAFSQRSMTCPLCRSPWLGSEEVVASGNDEGYVNLAHVSGQAPRGEYRGWDRYDY